MFEVGQGIVFEVGQGIVFEVGQGLLTAAPCRFGQETLY